MAKDRVLEQVVKDCILPDGRISWVEVKSVMEEKGQAGSTEMWRSRYRRQKPKGKRRVSEIGIKEVERMRAAGANVEVWFEDGELWYEIKPKLPIGTAEFAHLVEGKEVKIALLSDTHIGSNKFDLEHINAFYDYAYNQGVREFYHCGDISDGMYKNRDDSFYEQNHHGFSEQLNAVIKLYPKMDGVKTYFITGNHDATHVRNGGANIGEAIELGRDDMIYLGHNFAKVWLTDKVDLNMIHPTDGSSISYSHKLQKIIDNAEGQRRAAIMAVGHYHKTLWMPYKGVYGMLMPSFQQQTPFMRDNNLKSYVGGFILTLKFDVDGNLLSLTPEFMDYTEY